MVNEYDLNIHLLNNSMFSVSILDIDVFKYKLAVNISIKILLVKNNILINEEPYYSDTHRKDRLITRSVYSSFILHSFSMLKSMFRNCIYTCL